MSDLTRWNRSSLSRLRYVQGNAATYLDQILAELARGFPDWLQARTPNPVDDDAAPDDEHWAHHHDNQELIQQYLAERGDLALELARSFARSIHVLTEQIDAHANATFLRTATDWDDVRKIVAMLDYQPVGASSATTWLAIEARAKGTIDRGLQVRYRPPDGPALLFETLDDLDVDPNRNAFTVAGRNQSRAMLGDVPEGTSLWGLPNRVRLFEDESALILGDVSAQVVSGATIDSVGSESLALIHTGTAWEAFTVGTARLRSSPRFRRKPWFNGRTIRRSDNPHGLSEGSVVAWMVPGDLDPRWRFAVVARSDQFGIELTLPGHLQGLPPVDPVEGGLDRTTGTWDAIWPIFPSGGTIVVRPAIKLTGTVAVPAGSEAEAVLGTLSDFIHTDAMSRGNQVPANNKGLQFTAGGLEEVDVGTSPYDDQLQAFIAWLIGAIGFSIPLTPDILVDLGAMIKTKDARIPSTGQLVFEAFLDLFGAAGTDLAWTTSTDKPALFRFWGSGLSETGRLDLVRDEDRLVTGELWYFPALPGGGDLADPTLSFRNESDENWFFFEGRSTGLEIGDWAAAKIAGRPGWHPVKIVDRVESLDPVLTTIPHGPPQRYVRGSAFALLLEAGTLFDEGDELQELQADYRAEDALIGAGVNQAPVPEWVQLDPCPPADTLKRTLLAVNGAGESQLVTVEGLRDQCEAQLSPSLPASFTEGDLILYGNVVRVGHGERRPDIRRSGGTAADRGSRLLVQQQRVSTVPDVRFAEGTREDIDVVIDDALWRHVARLDDSGPTDRHFMVGTTEDGHLELHFGDGRHGRRLPAGIDNVRVRFRTGAGNIGEVPAGSLEKLVSPNPLVLAVKQPLASTGGAEMEQPEDMRERAPASLLALERAVSARDFEHLATRQRRVSQARGVYRPGAPTRHDQVEVIVVPTAGGLDETERAELEGYLELRALPTVDVIVREARPVPVVLDIVVWVDARVFTFEEVIRLVERQVTDRFSMERRSIGKAMHLSEVYGVVETVQGVEHSECSFHSPTAEVRVEGASDEVVFVENEAAIHCSPRIYTP